MLYFSAHTSKSHLLQWPPSRGDAWRTNQDIAACNQVINMLEDEMKPTYSLWKESVLMFRTYQEVLLPGECPGPGIGLPHHLTKDVSDVVDDALELRLVVLVRESGPTDLILHSRCSVLKPFVAPEEVLHTDIMYRFIISRTTNECVVLTNLV
jgi:hypothetical protein